VTPAGYEMAPRAVTGHKDSTRPFRNVPQFFLAAAVQQCVIAINFVFDTLLFAGMVLVISKAISDTESRPISGSYG
jgi:hypothetical protein